MIAMRDDTADRLARHKRMMEEHSSWLDESPGKRREVVTQSSLTADCCHWALKPCKARNGCAAW
jgi:hypothetical protein